jgi:hypothetical protein
MATQGCLGCTGLEPPTRFQLMETFPINGNIRPSPVSRRCLAGGFGDGFSLFLLPRKLPPHGPDECESS